MIHKLCYRTIKCILSKAVHPYLWGLSLRKDDKPISGRCCIFCADRKILLGKYHSEALFVFDTSAAFACLL